MIATHVFFFLPFSASTVDVFSLSLGIMCVCRGQSTTPSFAEWNIPRNSLKCPNKCTDCCCLFSFFLFVSICSLKTVNNLAFVHHFIRNHNSPVKICILRESKKKKTNHFSSFIIYSRQNSHAYAANRFRFLSHAHLASIRSSNISVLGSVTNLSWWNDCIWKNTEASWGGHFFPHFSMMIE